MILFAYNFGFVRAPDWMDPVVLALLVAFLAVWGASIATKPAKLPIADMYRATMPPLPTWLWRISVVLFALLMGTVFLGMGLARA